MHEKPNYYDFVVLDPNIKDTPIGVCIANKTERLVKYYSKEDAKKFALSILENCK